VVTTAPSTQQGTVMLSNEQLEKTNNSNQQAIAKNKLKKAARAALFNSKVKAWRGRGRYSRGKRYRSRRFGRGNRLPSNNWSNHSNWSNRRGQYQNYGYGNFQPQAPQQPSNKVVNRKPISRMLVRR